MNSAKQRTIRACVATVLTILVIVAVWKYIDYQTTPPPPPNKVATPAPGR